MRLRFYGKNPLADIGSKTHSLKKSWAIISIPDLSMKARPISEKKSLKGRKKNLDIAPKK